jgi:hypothetical protein
VSPKGFSTKSTAPCLSADTAIGTSPWPVMNTTGRPQRRRPSSSNTSSPLMPGMRTSSSTQPVISGRARGEEGLARLVHRDRVAVGLQHPGERVAQGFVVVDDMYDLVRRCGHCAQLRTPSAG